MKNSDNGKTSRGGCLCGGVRFEARGPLRDIIACHCRQCRKSSGHYAAATAVHPQNLIMTEERGLQWFRSSEFARRGFCRVCGSSLFYKPDSAERVAIFAGALDGDTGLPLVAHIFVADKGDYYDLRENDGIAVFPGGSSGTGLAAPKESG